MVLSTTLVVLVAHISPQIATKKTEKYTEKGHKIPTTQSMVDYVPFLCLPVGAKFNLLK